MLKWIFTYRIFHQDVWQGIAVMAIARKSFGLIRGNRTANPRDRQSTFEPQIVPPKLSTKLAMIDNAILSLYARGMTVRDIQATLQELYHVEVSNSLNFKVTEEVN